MTLLHLAAPNWHTRSVELLAEKGASIVLIDIEWWQPLTSPVGMAVLKISI